MSDILEYGVATVTANVTVTTTTEEVAVSSPVVRMPRASHTIVVSGWCQLTTGAATTTVTPRIRRGTTTSGTAVGDAVAENVKAAAGSNEPFFLMVSESRADVDSVQYSFTIEQTSATGNGTILQAGIEVMVLDA